MKETIKILLKDLRHLLRWTIYSSIVGTTIGFVGVAFVKLLHVANDFRGEHPAIIWGLPIAGIIIVTLYKMCDYENDGGTNLVISTIHEKSTIPFKMAPLIFISTVLTHMFGGSAGREGAALQLGGSIGNQFGRWFKLKDSDIRTIVMCGMSAAFAAIFGTPMAAVIFAMEVNSVGIMYYSAFVPCVVSALAASSLAQHFGVHAEYFGEIEAIAFEFMPAVKIVFLGLFCAAISVIFCMLLHKAGHLYKEYLKNAYLRVIVSGCLIIALTYLLGTNAYSGAGANLIEEAVAGHAPKSAFLWKMLFTAITLGAGFKGGEIVPSFAIGATFGALFASFVGLPVSLCAAIGMISLFCGVTNAPIAALLIGFELFGLDIMPYLLISVSFSYKMSGYYSLYHEQKIIFSKFHTKYVNRDTK